MIITMTITVSQWNVYDHYNPGWMKKAEYLSGAIWRQFCRCLLTFLSTQHLPVFILFCSICIFCPDFFSSPTWKWRYIWNCSNFTKKGLRKKTIHESMKGWYISFIASIYWSSKTVIGELKSKSDTLDLQVTPKTCILRSDQARWLFKWSAWNIWFCRCQQYFVI